MGPGISGRPRVFHAGQSNFSWRISGADSAAHTGVRAANVAAQHRWHAQPRASSAAAAVRDHTRTGNLVYRQPRPVARHRCRLPVHGHLPGRCAQQPQSTARTVWCGRRSPVIFVRAQHTQWTARSTARPPLSRPPRACVGHNQPHRIQHASAH